MQLIAFKGDTKGASAESDVQRILRQYSLDHVDIERFLQVSPPVREREAIETQYVEFSRRRAPSDYSREAAETPFRPGSETEPLAREAAEQKWLRAEAERAAQQKAEQERQGRERAEAAERERRAKAQGEQERLAREKAGQQKLEPERAAEREHAQVKKK